MEIRGTALVTGASRGIGRALAIELAARGFDVIAAMRQPEDGADLPSLAAAAARRTGGAGSAARTSDARPAGSAGDADAGDAGDRPAGTADTAGTVSSAGTVRTAGDTDAGDAGDRPAGTADTAGTVSSAGTVRTAGDTDAGDRPAGTAGTVRRAGTITVQRMDVTDPASISVPDDLRVLVNNAGLDVDHTPVEHADAVAWREMFETNVLGSLHMCQAAIPVLRANAPGVIANVTSSSILAPVPFYAGYRGAKAAVSAMCDTLRVEMAPFGVRVVEILPGPVDTDMFQVTRGLGPAARYELYRAMAEAAEEGRRAHADPMVVTPEAAAGAIADALLDDGGPMRYSCDPLGVGLLDVWRHSSDEEMYAMVGGSPGPAGAPDEPAGTSPASPAAPQRPVGPGAIVVEGHVADHLLNAFGMRRVNDPEAGPSLEMDVRPQVTNPHGGLHGGLMAVLIECGAAGTAVRACDSEMIVAGDMLIRFLSAARIGPARVVGRVLRAGRRQVVVQADVLDIGDDRRLVASATLAYARL